MIDHTLRDLFPSLNVYHMYPPLIDHDFDQISIRGNKIYNKSYQISAKKIKITN